MSPLPAAASEAGPPDRIEVRGLRLMAVVGVLPEERTRAQPIEVDLDLESDLSAAGQSDALDDTVDYGAVCDAVAAAVAADQPELLERLAALIADAVLAAQPRVDAVVVSVRKLRPPVAHAVATTGVRIARRRRS